MIYLPDVPNILTAATNTKPGDKVEMSNFNRWLNGLVYQYLFFLITPGECFIRSTWDTGPKPMTTLPFGKKKKRTSIFHINCIHLQHVVCWIVSLKPMECWYLWKLLYLEIGPTLIHCCSTCKYLESHHWCPYKRHTERKSHEERGKHWSDVSSSQGMPIIAEATRSYKGMHQFLPENLHLHFQLLKLWRVCTPPGLWYIVIEMIGN